MAKDVDLSSKEWRDLIFEGKNKEYGAYEMRKNSDKRHNKAMIAVVIIAILAFGATALVSTIVANLEARPTDEGEQVLAEMVTDSQQEEEQEEEQQRVEQPIEQQKLPEEVLNTVKMTEILIQEDNKVVEQIKSRDEVLETTTAVGAVDNDKGRDDLTLEEKHKDEVVVEKKETPPPAPVEKPEENKVFDVVEQMPVFPGGEAALLKYVSSHINYPPMAAENNIQGRVVVKFVVTKTGSIGKVQVVRSKDPDLDKEAVRVVKTLPKFTPGKMNGHPVDVWYTLPINFKLQGV